MIRRFGRLELRRLEAPAQLCRECGQPMELADVPEQNLSLLRSREPA